MYAGVPRFDLYVPYDEVRVVRIVSQDNVLLVQKVKIPEPRSLQDYEVRVSCRFAVRGDGALLAPPVGLDLTCYSPLMLG